MSMRKTSKKLLSFLLVFCMCAVAVPELFVGRLEVQAAEEAWNLAQRQPVKASGSADDTAPENAVDGDAGTSWNSTNLKNFNVSDTSKDQEAQTPQWIQIDLGHTGSVISQIAIKYKNNKVWSMAYRVQTSDTPEDNNSWEDAAVVSRSSFNGTLVNGEGQNIANASNYTDTLTTSSVPALTKTNFKRFVRIYFEKTNAQAGGHNVNIAEIEIMGTNPFRKTPSGYLNNISAEDLQIVNGQVVLPEAQGLEVYVRGSELEQVVSNSGAIIGWNIGSRDVTLLIQAKETGNETNWAEKNVTISVPDHKDAYPSNWFPEVTHANPRPEVIPSIQEWYGYEGDFQLTTDSKIILQDTANVGLVKAAENMKADVEEISDISLEVVNGGQPRANDICIESLTTDTYGVGSEGYVIVTNEKGLHIYAPTYTGCLYGTITAEQILWQAADHLSIPKGIMRDYPSYEIRGIKLDVARTPYRYQQLKDYAKIMLWYKMNEYGLHINDNDNSHIAGATLETHAGFHRLESSTFPSLKSETKHAGIPQDLVNAEYYNENEDYQGNPTYTKEEWRKLTEQSKDYGMHMLTEIDLPGHSLLYNKYAAENPDQIDWLEGGTMIGSTETGYLELLDLTGENKERALRFGRELWEEYTDPKNPTIYGDIIHIGSDEYWVHNAETKDGFAEYADEMRKVIQKNLGPDTKIRMWGAGSGMFSTAKEFLGMTDEELAANYQLDIWYPGYDNANQRVHEGYGVVNCRDSFMYGNPGRRFRDVPNAEYLFNDWNPTNFGGGNTMIGEPNLLGAKAVLWGDQSQEGMTERDIHQRVLRAVAIVSEKTWGGTAKDDTFSEYELRAGRLAEGPGTEIAMKIDSETSLVLDYDFKNISQDKGTVYDTSGNGYDASLTGGDVEDGWLSFDGSTLLSTPLKTLSYPYTVSFDVKAGTGNTKESSLLSGYDGRIQVAGHDGHMSADVNYFTRDFGYTLPTDGSTKNITIVGTFQATRLYVDGELVSFLSQKQDQDGLAEGGISTLYSSVLLPLEKIGQDFHGEMANLKVYNKAMSASEIFSIYNGEKPELVNVAQNTNAGSKCYTAGNNAESGDNGEQRTSIAMKAIDGEAFTSEEGASSEIYSYWMGGMGDSALTVDLGKERSISRIDIQWRTDGIGNNFKIQASDDGKNWETDVKIVSGNTDSRQQILLDAPVKTRFLLMQGTQSSGNYKIQEFLAYEQADKSALEGKIQEMEQTAAEKETGFESAGVQREIFQSILLAKAVLDSPLAVQADAERAISRFEEAVKELDELQETKEEMESVLTSLKSVIEAGQGEYSIESWQAFVNAYEEASKAFAEADTARLKALAAKLEKLEKAKGELQKSSTITPDPISVKPVKTGDKVKDKNGNFEYRILSTDKKTAAVIKGLKPESKKVEIPASEEFSGVNYQIVEVEAKALKGYKKMTSLTIGANVEKIGNQAFAGNKKLKSVKVTGTKIKKVLKKAFKGTGKKMTVQFPKKLKKSKKMALMKKFKSAGMTKKAKMK